ncbi:Endoglucanase 3 [Hordeum vulgare]|nr:Endoglucanase 3 [Hordeum vulgare]
MSPVREVLLRSLLGSALAFLRVTRTPAGVSSSTPISGAVGRSFVAVAVTKWTELRNSCEGVHEVQAIQYFIDGCRDGTLLKHKLMCSEPTSLAVLMAKADKYATTDSVMRVKVTASDKAVPTPATPKPVGDG